MTVLVTGGAGYIGGHMVLAFLDAGGKIEDWPGILGISVETLEGTPRAWSEAEWFEFVRARVHAS